MILCRRLSVSEKFLSKSYRIWETLLMLSWPSIYAATDRTFSKGSTMRAISLSPVASMWSTVTPGKRFGNADRMPMTNLSSLTAAP
jgi:hypothetical protein